MSETEIQPDDDPCADCGGCAGCSEQCHHGVGFDEACDDCDDEMQEPKVR